MLEDDELAFEIARVWDKYDLDPEIAGNCEVARLVEDHNPDIDFGGDGGANRVGLLWRHAEQVWRAKFPEHARAVYARRGEGPCKR